tara:strand:- start:576 stop:797 length:222 start_codon:yes stop_codon:yes gene_type:complete
VHDIGHAFSIAHYIHADCHELNATILELRISVLQLDELLPAYTSEKPAIENEHHGVSILPQLCQRHRLTVRVA